MFSNYVPVFNKSDKWIEQLNKVKEIDELFNLKIEEGKLNQYVILFNKESNGKTKLAIDYANSLLNRKIVKWINASSSEKIKMSFRNFLNELNLFCIPNDLKGLREHLKKKLSKDGNNYLFIFDNVKNFKEVRDNMLIWPINVKVLITTKDESMVKIEEIPTFDEQKIIKDILREPENIDSIRYKIETLGQYLKIEPIDILVLKWMVALNEEFIFTNCFLFLLSVSNMKFELYNKKHDLFEKYLIHCSTDLLPSFHKLKDNGFIDFVIMNGKEFFKINNVSILRDLFNDIELLEKEMVLIFKIAFPINLIAEQHKMLYPVIVNFLENFKCKENETIILLSDLYFTLSGYEKSIFADFQKQYFYLNKCLDIRKECCPDDEDRMCEIKNSTGLYYIENAKNENCYKIAIENLSEALDIALKQLAIGQKINSNIHMCYSNLGLAYLKLGDLMSSKFYFLSALSYMNLSGTNDSSLPMMIYNNLSNLYARMDNFDLALKFIDKSLSIQYEDFHEHRAQILINKGNICMSLEDYKEAIESFEQAKLIIESLEKFKKTYSSELKLTLYLSYGLLLREIGEVNKSTVFLEKAHLIQKSLYLNDNFYLKSNFEQNEAIKLFQERDIYFAKHKLERALNSGNLFKSNNIEIMISYALVLALKGDTISSIIFLYQALDLTYKSNRKKQRIEILNKIGKYFLEKKMFKTSISYYLDAHNIYVEVFGNKDNLKIAETFLGIAMSHCDLNNFEESYKFALRSLEIHENLFENNTSEHVRNNDLCVLYELIGENYGKLGKNNEQVYYLEKCLIKLYTLLPNYFTCEEIEKIESNAIDPVVNLVNSSPKVKAEKLNEGIMMMENKIKEKK